jgi:hypothetical protein
MWISRCPALLLFLMVSSYVMLISIVLLLRLTTGSEILGRYGNCRLHGGQIARKEPQALYSSSRFPPSQHDTTADMCGSRELKTR